MTNALCSIGDTASLKNGLTPMISQIKWPWQGRNIEVGVDSQGKGPAVLMLSGAEFDFDAH